MVGGAAILAAVAAAGVLRVTSTDAVEASDAATAPATVEVQRTSVDQKTVLRGVITHSARGNMVTLRGGVVTSSAQAGAVLTSGSTLARIDDRPIVVFRGDVPAWRTIEPAVADGPDVRQLEQGLQDLGFFHGTVDTHFTEFTETAIMRWQRSLQLEPTGSVTLGDIVFLSEELRVGSVKAASGSVVASGDVLAASTAIDPVVQAKVTVEDRAHVAPEAAAAVILPNGHSVTGSVASVGAPEDIDTETADQKGGAAERTDSGATALVRLDGAADGIRDGDAVRVEVTTPGITDAVVVPVTAVIATGRDTYAVERLHDGTVTRRVVTLGTAAGGYVEIRRGLTVGDRVVIPR